MKAKKLAILLACALTLSLLPAALAASNTAASAGSKSDAAASDSTQADSQAGKATDAGSSADSSTEYTGPSEELLAWAKDRDCAACHTTEGESAQNEKSAMSIHSLLSMDCITCHADDALIDIHATAKADKKAPTKLKKSKLTVEACATCHPQEMLIKATAESTALVDSEGTVVNPHDIPDVKDHKKFTCGSCHKMHSDMSPKAKAPALCTDCHHEDVYECYTCHS